MTNATAVTAPRDWEAVPGFSPLTYGELREERAYRDARRDFATACERTVAPGRCTGCEAPAEELIPWSGERLCWDCTDTQMDLLAKVLLEEYPAHAGTRGLR
jgi:hypothetical protein